MKSILIKGYYGYENLGDDFLLYSILDVLNRKGKYRVTVLSAGDDYEWLFSKFKNLDCVAFIKPWRKFNKLYLMLKHDYWIIGGGGLFPAEVDGMMTNIFKEISFAKMTGCKICIYGVDINSINYDSNKEAWKKISEIVDFIIVRNDRSIKLLEELKCKNVYRSSDITFGLETFKEKDESKVVLEKINCKENEYITWAIPMPWFENEYSESKYGKRYRQLLSDLVTIANLPELKKYKHILLPFYYGMDCRIAYDLEKMIEGEAIVIDKNINMDIEEKRLLFKYAKFNICMRFHGAMFSIYGTKPALIISYSNKTTNVINEMGLEKYLIEYGIRKSADFYDEFDLNKDKLKKVLENVLSKNANQDFEIASKKLKEMSADSKNKLSSWLPK